MRPVVHTVRGPQISGKRLSIALSSLISASPASRLRVIEVVPAWFCSPVTVMPYCQIATIAVTTPMRFSSPSSEVALLDVRLEERCRSAPARSRGAAGPRNRRLAAPRAAACRRVLFFALSTSASVSRPVNDFEPRNEPKCPSSSANTTTSTPVSPPASLIARAGFQRVDAAERAVEPAGLVLAFEMRARQRLAPVARATCPGCCRCRRWWSRARPRCIARRTTRATRYRPPKRSGDGRRSCRCRRCAACRDRRAGGRA